MTSLTSAVTRRFRRALVLAAAIAPVLAALDVPLTVEDRHGYTRRSENVSTGVPLPRGAVHDVARLAVLDPAGNPVPAQFETLATWPDGSAKWVLVDFA